MKIARNTLSLALFASGIVGTRILLTDRWLWSAAPTHAVGLVGFVLMDSILIGAALKRIGLAASTAILTAAVQFAAMLADLVGGQPMGVPAIAFKNYLLNDASYVGLLFLQIAIVIVAISILTTRILQKPPHTSIYQRFHRQRQARPC